MALKLGNAPCSWGVFYPKGNAITPVGYLDAVARAGYRVTEFGPLGFLGEDAVWIAEALVQRGLALSGASHVHTLSDLSSEGDLTAALHRLGPLLQKLGAPDLILMDESEAYPAAAQGVVDAAVWQGAMQMIRRAEAMLKGDYGVRLHMHPHVGTFLERGAQIDRLLGETGVSLCFDTGHHAFWDQDVLAYLQRIHDRIGVMHLKNVNPRVRARVLAGDLGVNVSFDHGVMCPLAEGVVDIRAVVRFLQSREFAGFTIIEQDPASPPDLVACEVLAAANLAFVSGP